MKFGIDLPPFGPYASARAVADLARLAEEVGWDGFFIWDHLSVAWPAAVGDTGTSLAAIAMNTTRIRFGPMVMPLPRRRPWKVARETVALDHLSNGRLILGVGLGLFSHEFDYLGEEPTMQGRAAMLDEALTILTGLWTGEPFHFKGQHYRVQEAHFMPTPVQQPRIPIWVAATWPKKAPLRRAARWDGIYPLKVAADGMANSMQPDEVREMLAYILQHRTGDAPLDVPIWGSTAGETAAAAAAKVAAYEAAGATWWIEATPMDASAPAQVEARIRRGPPRG